MKLLSRDYLPRRPVWRELSIFLAFCVMTAALSWPYVTRLRDAVVDPGDPYLIAWILWWDYHQTFTDPLNLFHSNVFYPYRYTLAFSEHSYGIALFFFPLYALGFRPLTVHAVAMFFGFVTCGYGAFRLGRTLTNSYTVAWVAGIIFAFIPYRFHLMSQVAYLFSPWIPLLLEALVLFARVRSRRRAVWLGVAFFMSGLTSLSWFTLSLVPFALSAALLIVRYRIERERDFWQRGAIALGAASLALLPFMLPYYIASKMYGFKRSIEEVKANSALPIHWLAAERRNKLWSTFGANLPGGWKFKLFPGLLPLLLSLAALLLVEPLTNDARRTQDASAPARSKLLMWLDAFAVAMFVSVIVVTGYEGAAWLSSSPYSLLTTDRALLLFIVALVARLCVAYPDFLRRGENENLIQTIRSTRRSEAYWLASLWVVIGFCYSLGLNFFFYRILYDFVPLFKSMRVATRGAMFCYLGLAILAGLGTSKIAELIGRRHARLRPATVCVVVCALLLFELNAAPLEFMRGDVYPDAVTLRLKETPMRGGIVVLPAGADYNHRHILRAADHQRPLIVGTSGFNPPYEDQIEALTREYAIPLKFLDLLEQIPASYLVVQNNSLAPERRVGYEAFLSRAVASGRLRFVERFDGRDDLYVVTKTEPEAAAQVRTEAGRDGQPPPASLPFEAGVVAWDALLENSPVHLLNQFRDSSQRVYRLHKATYGRMPRFDDFMRDVRIVAKNVEVGVEGQDKLLDENLRRFAQVWTERAEFQAAFKNKSNERYVDELFANAEVTPEGPERASLVEALNAGSATHASVLLAVADNPKFVEQERYRSLLLLHYFGYLRRNPGDPPDKDMSGFKYWLNELERYKDTARLTAAFADSGEYKALNERR